MNLHRLTRFAQLTKGAALVSATAIASVGCDKDQPRYVNATNPASSATPSASIPGATEPSAARPEVHVNAPEMPIRDVNGAGPNGATARVSSGHDAGVGVRADAGSPKAVPSIGVKPRIFVNSTKTE